MTNNLFLAKRCLTMPSSIVEISPFLFLIEHGKPHIIRFVELFTIGDCANTPYLVFWLISGKFDYVRKIEENLGLLSDLQSFNKKAFIGDDKFSQDVCNIILAFAHIWNDDKSFALYLDHVQTRKPTAVKK